jgi:hypothetical protein
MDHRLVAVRAKTKMTSVCSSRNGCATIGISEQSQCDIPRDFADMPQSGKKKPSCSKIPQIWRTSFYEFYKSTYVGHPTEFYIEF